MKQRELEMLLQRVPAHPAPRAELEQVPTPAPIAADLLYRALAAGDLDGKRVLDLGCGTGVLAVGALLLGAREAVGADVDEDALALAAHAAQDLGVADRARWLRQDVQEVRVAADTVVMNPPFGAQRRHADQPFHVAGLASAPVVYVLVNGPARAWAERFYVGAGARVTATWSYAFPLPARFWFHDKPVERIEVVAMRVARG